MPGPMLFGAVRFARPGAAVKFCGAALIVASRASYSYTT